VPRWRQGEGHGCTTLDMLDSLLAMLWVALFGATTGFAAGALAGAAVEFILADAARCWGSASRFSWWRTTVADSSPLAFAPLSSSTRM
jgi:hypothetical protein